MENLIQINIILLLNEQVPWKKENCQNLTQEETENPNSLTSIQILN